MKLNYFFKFLLILSVLFTGCEENFPYEDILDLSGTSSGVTSYSLSVNQMDVYLDENESYKKTIEVNSSNVNWTITDIPEWLTVTPTNGGNGKTEVRLVAKTLPADEKRAVQLKLQSTSSEYSWTEYITVSQGYTLNGYEYVDLGLPSGLKWATCNLGATRPEECGDYYAWGEINTKYSYIDDNSLTYENSRYNIDISGNMKYDAASYCWKGTWRMPTKDEFTELIENCAWEWTAVNGVNGYRVTSITNGNSIFLPAVGYMSGSNVISHNTSDYWTGSYYSSNSNYDNHSYCFSFKSGSYKIDYRSRYIGRPIRPVFEQKK